MTWHDMILYDMIWYYMTWYDMISYGMVWYGMVWYTDVPMYSDSYHLPACIQRHMHSFTHHTGAIHTYLYRYIDYGQ